MVTTIRPARPVRPATVRQTALHTLCGLCGFLTVFGLAHLLLTEITKPSGYAFFGTLAVVSPLVGLLAARFAPGFAPALRRLAFGAACCLVAIPAVYLARFAPADAQQTARNLIGLPFFALALVGPGLFRRGARRDDAKL